MTFRVKFNVYYYYNRIFVSYSCDGFSLSTPNFAPLVVVARGSIDQQLDKSNYKSLHVLLQLESKKDNQKYDSWYMYLKLHLNRQ